MQFHNSLSGLSREKLIELANRQTWVHTIDFGGGYTTPGMWGGGNPQITQCLDLIDFRGQEGLGYRLLGWEVQFPGGEQGGGQSRLYRPLESA